MGVRSDLTSKARGSLPEFSRLLGSVLVDDSVILGVETVTENATACSITVPVTVIDNDGDEALSLADGTSVGQIKIFISSTANTVTLTPATTAGAYSTIATTNIGETYILMWCSDGWAVLSRTSGDTQDSNTVDDIPVLA